MGASSCVHHSPGCVELLFAHLTPEEALQVEPGGGGRRTTRTRWVEPYLLKGLLRGLWEVFPECLAALCLLPCLCHCRGQPPTQHAGCWPPTCLCLTAAYSVVSASCGHKPYSECLLQTRPGAAGPVVPTSTGDPLAGAGHGSQLVWKATTRSGCSNAGGRTRPAVKQGVVATSKLATQKVSAWFGAMAQVRKAWDSRVPGPGPKKR